MYDVCNGRPCAQDLITINKGGWSQKCYKNRGYNCY